MPHVISIPPTYKMQQLQYMNLLPTQPFGRRCDKYLLDRFLIVDLSKQNRPVLFFQDTYTRSLELVHACSIFQNSYIRYSELEHACSIFSDPYTRSLELVHACSIFLKPIYQVPGISTRLFYFFRPIYQVPGISTHLFYFFKTHILDPWNQYTPVLFFIRHI